MNRCMCSVLAVSLAASAPLATRSAPVSAVERTSLQALHAPGLEDMRAGGPSRSAVTLDERAQLRQAEQRSRGLESLRAGVLSNRELMWLLIGLVVITLIVVL